MLRSRWTSKGFVLPALGVLVSAIHVWRIWPWTLDDAFIYMRYAQNFAEGHGPVYNPGERCEGYSSFLWVSLLAGLHALGLPLLATVKVLVAASVAGCIVLVSQAWRIANGAFGRAECQWASLFLGTCSAFSPWATAGMETPLLALLLTWLCLWWLRLREEGGGLAAWVGIGLLGAACAMTRPEGLMVFGLVGLDAFLRSFRGGSRRFWWTAVAFGAVFVPWFVWRLDYYGYPLPNTYYAKVGNTSATWERGLLYLRDWLKPAAALLILLPLGLCAARPVTYARSFVALFVIWCCYVVYVGGDFMPAFRFMAPITPLLCLVAAVGALRLPAYLMVVALAATSFWGIWSARETDMLDGFIELDEVGVVARAVGEWLRDNTSEDAVIAVNAAGAIPFFAQRRAVDMLGLNDVHIAHRDVPGMGNAWAGHEKGDGAYVLSKKPDYILFGAFGNKNEPQYLSGKEMVELPEFQKNYVLQLHAISPETKSLDIHAFVMWVRR